MQEHQGARHRVCQQLEGAAGLLEHEHECVQVQMCLTSEAPLTSSHRCLVAQQCLQACRSPGQKTWLQEYDDDFPHQCRLAWCSPGLLL